MKGTETAQSRLGLRRMVGIQKAVVFLGGMMAAVAHSAITVSPGEMAQKNQWMQQHLLTAANPPPFSFTYGGQPSSTVLPPWMRVKADAILDKSRTQHVVTWTNGVLQVRCVAVEYNDFPMVEWTVYLMNIGTRVTPILEGIQGLDATFQRGNDGEFILRGNRGDFCTADSYEPYQITLNPSTAVNFSPPSYSGKSCDGPNGWPYYNLQTPGGGIILAIGWPGQWASSFTRDAANDLRIRAGQQLTHLCLNPGEEIRTPLVSLLFWQGTDVVRAQNLWRHWYLAHEIPRVNGQPPSALAQIQVMGSEEDIAYVDKFLEAGIKPDLCWRDDQYMGKTWYPAMGTWEVDPKIFPNGFRPFSDWIHARGMKFVLWFEPERVGDPNSWLGTKHPEWLLPGTGSTNGDILNEGDPAAFRWLTNHIDGLIKSQGIDWYREDMNGAGPLATWRNHDASNRQGITENFYVQNHLAYWDALLAMNPGLRIDSCASGGRRNDLETLRRAVPLLRSDFQFPSMEKVVDGNQCQTYGLSSWLPFQGTGCYLHDPYSFRSFYLAAFGFGMARLSSANVAAQQQGYAECKRIAPILLNGDFYPLTPYSLSDTVWMAWQFDRPEQGGGVVQAFRRAKSPHETARFKLCGLDAAANYEVENFDGGKETRTGSELMGKGLAITATKAPAALIFVYRRLD